MLTGHNHLSDVIFMFYTTIQSNDTTKILSLYPFSFHIYDILCAYLVQNGGFLCIFGP